MRDGTIRKGMVWMKLGRLEMERHGWIYNILWEQKHQTLKLNKGKFIHSTNIENQQTQSPIIYSLLHQQGFKTTEGTMSRRKALEATNELM